MFLIENVSYRERTHSRNNVNIISVKYVDSDIFYVLTRCCRCFSLDMLAPLMEKVATFQTHFLWKRINKKYIVINCKTTTT